MTADLIEMLAEGPVTLVLPSEKAAKQGGLELSVLLNQAGSPVNVVRSANHLTLTLR
jgi:hypothetical protein